MLICSKRMPQAKGLAKALVQRAATVTLDWDTRQKSRFEAHDSQGRVLGVVLPRGTVVRGGDVLVAEHGGRAASYTEAAGQAVMAPAEITVPAASLPTGIAWSRRAARKGRVAWETGAVTLMSAPLPLCVALLMSAALQVRISKFKQTYNSW